MSVKAVKNSLRPFSRIKLSKCQVTLESVEHISRDRVTLECIVLVLIGISVIAYQIIMKKINK